MISTEFKRILSYYLFGIFLIGLLPMYVVASAFTIKESAVDQDNTQTKLLRRARWQASFGTEKYQSGHLGKTITKLAPSSALRSAGLQLNDEITQVNGSLIKSPEHWYDITDAIVAGRTYLITINRDGKHSTFNVEFPPEAKEQHKGLITTYGQLTSPSGIQQRYILTRPKHTDNQAALLFLQGLSCSSIEVLPHRQSNYVKLINAIVEQSNMVVMRIEKPGVGDSEGQCSNTNFHDELAGYEAAMQTLQALPYVNKQNIIVYGNSMGSAIAPYIANKYQAKAIVADGTFYRSWFEHMLEIERRILAMKGNTQSEITAAMNTAYIPLYYGMLIKKKSYQQLIDETPSLARYNYHSPAHMYGRPMQYYHQVQEFDFAGEWQKVTVPVKIRWGKNDWIMSEADNDMIVEALLAKGNADVELVKPDGLDHWATIHTSAANSFSGKPGKWDNSIDGQIINWLHTLSK